MLFYCCRTTFLSCVCNGVSNCCLWCFAAVLCCAWLDMNCLLKLCFALLRFALPALPCRWLLICRDGACGVKPLLGLLRQPCTPLSKKRRVLETLTFLAANPSIAHSICNHDGIALLLQVVVSPADDLQLEAAEALQALLLHHYAQARFCSLCTLFLYQLSHLHLISVTIPVSCNTSAALGAVSHTMSICEQVLRYPLKSSLTSLLTTNFTLYVAHQA